MDWDTATQNWLDYREKMIKKLLKEFGLLLANHDPTPRNQNLPLL
jgi:hypothetical protein